MGVISSVFGPLKGSCRAEGEEKITGADIICFCHVDLTSGLTHTVAQSYTDAKWMYLHTCSDTMCARPRRVLTRTCSGTGTKCVLAVPEEQKSHTYTVLRPDRCTLHACASYPFLRELLQGFLQLDLSPCTTHVLSTVQQREPHMCTCSIKL